MSNFLHNLRQRQQNNQNDRRNNTNYNNNNNKVVPKVIQNKISEEIKTQLENISKNLAAQSKIVEKRIRIEERSADVMEKIVELLESSDGVHPKKG